MSIRHEKALRLEQVARLYYEQNKTQNEIARQLGVSRPLVSRMLHEAKEAGIVEIRIHTPVEGESLLLGKAKELFGIFGGVIIPDGNDDAALNQALATAAIDYIKGLGGSRLGIGWGSVVGTIATMLEGLSPEENVIKHVSPMVGNSGVSIRSYHSNENVRIISTQMKAEPHYLHTPAFAETKQEMELITQTEHYKAVYREWQQMDIAMVNIGNYPSSPDFASRARYGTLLSTRRAVGQLIAYYYDQQGKIIQSDTDYAIQIPLELLSSCQHVVGICSTNVNAKALTGALKTGLFTHLIAGEKLVQETLEMR